MCIHGAGPLGHGEVVQAGAVAIGQEAQAGAGPVGLWLVAVVVGGAVAFAFAAIGSYLNRASAWADALTNGKQPGTA